ncbi:Retinaldehyde-binding protein 1 [Orchesella cincta]|uniref:Retinaldehyde-binding protein 1 n=1 Tax=Orchesella cincta TaxID=48709 RepID=A0A1D2M9C3_ORCCI|nr:Retinaldehyde-binding protein 1 [Orchesella cincta]
MVKLNQEPLVETGLKEMRQIYKEFQGKEIGNKSVNDFLATSFNDEALLKRYLIGRKYRPQHAFDTLLSYAEVRFVKYPEMFPAVLPPKELLLRDNQPVFGILKGRDSQGRIVGYFRSGAWDPSKCTLEELAIIVIPIMEKALLNKDCLNNGIVFVHESGGMGFSHAKHYTFSAIIRFLNIYWHSFPLKVKGLYLVNVPTIFTYIYTMIKPFFPKKLQDRVIFFSTTSRKFKELHQRLSPDILPTFLGGTLDPREANDPEFIDLFSGQ